MRVARARERTGMLIMTAGLVVMAIGMVAGPAMADPHSGIDSQLYRPAVDPAGVFSVDGGATLPRYDLSLQLGVGYGHRPLRLIVPGIGDSGADAIIDFALAMHMTVGFGLSDRLSLVLDTGLYRTATGDGYGSRGRYRSTGPEPSTGIISLRPVSNIDPSGGFEAQGLSGPLDVRVGFKLGIIDGSALHVALLALASLPFGEDEMFLGDAGFVLSPKLALGYDFNADGTTKLAVNLGANLRRRTVLQAYNPHDPVAASPDDALAVLDVGSELTAGVGFTYELGKRLVGGAESMLQLPLPASLSMGSCSLYDGSRCASLDAAGYAEGAGYGDPTGYAVAGIRFRAGADVTLTASVGAGFLGARRDDARMMAGIIWTPVPKGMQPMGAGDRDGDGVLDVADLCPDEREDVDDYQDEDGCVDIDNDGDGIPDARDACPDDPEDKDGHLDTDGCPERDNDSDRIPDIKDRCPDAAEDADGFEDDDGCPDEDNDGDGILDGVDSCPNEPEVVNGIDDKDGCPDSRTQTGPAEDVDRINLRGNEIEFAGARSARLTEASEEVLEQIAELIKRRNLKVRVEVHVPSSTRSLKSRAQSRARRGDKALAQRRADAIIDYLAKRQSVPLPLLQAVGIGSDRPVKKPATDPQNGRVDFIKIEQKQP